jgi:hypothetical protein
MQPKPNDNTTTQNLQNKLITDARKLLKKVRIDQALSADSSIDSSLLIEKINLTDDDGLGGGSTTRKSKDSKLDDIELHLALKSLRDHENIPASTSSSLSLVLSSKSSIHSDQKQQEQSKNNKALKEDNRKDVGLDLTCMSHTIDNKGIEKLYEKNLELKLSNLELQEEISEFENKLELLEHTLGIIQDVENPSPKERHDRHHINNTSSYQIYYTEGPSPTQIYKSQEDELQILRENNEKMVTAIKALARATIMQAKKHYFYKKRHAEEKNKSNERQKYLKAN